LALLQAWTMSPNHVFRTELGDRKLGKVDLTQYELASEISFMFADTAPDAALLADAQQGKLTDPAVVRAHAERLLDSPAGREVLKSFFFDFLHLRELAGGGLEETEQALVPSMQAETAKFVEQVVFEQGGGLDTLLSSTQSTVDPPLAGFYGVTAGQPAEMAARLKRGQSVLDLVKQDLTAMRTGLSAQDRGHLDVYEGSVRELERRLGQTSSCDPQQPAPADWLGTGDAVDKLATNGGVLVDLIGQAFACGSRRVATLQWGEGALGVNPARTTKDHHWVTHFLGEAAKTTTDLDGDGKIDVQDSQQLCDRWYAARFESCISKFKALGILDDTVIVWCSETSEGHNQNNCVWIVAGGKNLGIQLCKVIEYPFMGEEGALMQARETARKPQNTSMADLWVSVQKALGVQQEGFGEPGMTTGGLKELLPA
jgi:hypothetical protein